jgi:hypothetical protein
MSVATVPIQQATIRQYAKRLQLPTLGGQFAQVPESTQGPMFSVYSVRADRCAVARASPRNKNSGFGDVELDSSICSAKQLRHDIFEVNRHDLVEVLHFIGLSILWKAIKPNFSFRDCVRLAAQRSA